MQMDEQIRKAFEYTKILKRPKQLISTFGSSNIHFYVLTEPVYSEFTKNKKETVVREGKVSWYQPKLFIPNYMFRLEGFSAEAKTAFEALANEYPDLAGILYKFKVNKELDEMNFVSDTLLNVAENINQKIEKSGDSLSAIILGAAGLWDVSLSKFILDMMSRSAYLAQIPDFAQKGFIGLSNTGQTVISKDKNGIPIVAREEIEKLFSQVKSGELEPVRLKEELDKWGLFSQYQDRFFNLFKKK